VTLVLMFFDNSREGRNEEAWSLSIWHRRDEARESDRGGVCLSMAPAGACVV
jgi:hypothetical protein